MIGEASHVEYLEATVMCGVVDHRSVGQNELTSDYWQGDEPKWQKSCAGGVGGIDVGKSQFDKSANRTIQQISLPIIDGNGKVIGAVCCGILSE